MTTPYHITVRRQAETVVPGKRLGRHAVKDSRSAAYPYRAPRRVPLQTVLWQRHAPIFDQGGTGSCTGQAMAGALATGPLWDGLPPGHPGMDEAEAVTLYGLATELDSIPGAYPPDDTGSDGTSVCKAAQKVGLISGYTHATSVDDVLQALMHGPVLLGVDWYDCLPDDQRVLTSDLRWIPIQKVQAGDELIGFDESLGMAARMRRSTVLAMDTKHRPVYEVVTSQGTVCASGGHLLVRCSTITPRGNRTKGRQEWVRTDQIKPGDHLAYFLEPYDEDTSWEAGWLSGFFDGEGTVAGDYQVNFGQVVGPTLERARALLEAKGFETSVKHVRPVGTLGGTSASGTRIVNRKEAANIYVTGPYHGALRFLGQMRPQRLLDDAATRLWEGRSPKSRRCPPAEVQSIRLVSTEPVHAIATTTQTLVVEGFLSHNSFDEPGMAGQVEITPGAQVRGGHEIAARGVDIDAKLIAMDNSWGESWGWKGGFQFSWATLDRLLAQDGDATVPAAWAAPPPVPVPVPPVAADANVRAWWAEVEGWANARHTGHNRDAALASLDLARQEGLIA